MTKSKIGEQDVERSIEVEFKHDKFFIKDKFENLIEKNAEGMVNFYTQVYQNNAGTLNRIKQMSDEMKRLWIDVEQNEELMEKLNPHVKKARLMLVKEQMEKERGGKKDEDKKKAENGVG